MSVTVQALDYLKPRKAAAQEEGTLR